MDEKQLYRQEYYKKHIRNLMKKNRLHSFRIKEIFSIYFPKKNEKILDIGCGAGVFSFELARRGFDVIGIDYSEDAIRLCKNLAERFNLNNAEFIKEDAMSMGIKSDSFDVIYAADFFEHLTLPAFNRVIKEIHRVMKINGKLIIWSPYPDHWIEQLKKRNILLKQDKSHFGLDYIKDISSYLEKNGFEVKKKEFAPTHLFIIGVIEGVLLKIPLFRRRIKILAVKK